MNFIDARKIIIQEIKKIKISHCPNSIIENTYQYSHIYSCNKCLKGNLFAITNRGVYLNINKNEDNIYYGFVLKDSTQYNNYDLILELDDFLNILNLQDFNKYKEKYNSLILFK